MNSKQAKVRTMGKKRKVLTFVPGTAITATTMRPCTVMGHLEKLRRDAEENRDLLRRQEEKAKEIAESAGQIADAVFESGTLKAMFELNMLQRCPTVRMRVQIGDVSAVLDEEEVRALVVFLGLHLSGK